MAVRHDDPFPSIWQNNWSRRRGEPYPPNVSCQIFNFNSPRQKKYHNNNVPYLTERYGYSEYLYRDDRPPFSHRYFEPTRFSSVQRDMLVAPFQQQYPNNHDRHIKFRESRSKKNSHDDQRKSHTDGWKIENAHEAVHPPKDDNFVKFEEASINLNESVEPPNREESESCSVLNYCLDPYTQHTIHRLQNDFRLTKKYKTFVMSEMPLIPDFKPTPATTTNKFHDRFKCISKQLLNEKAMMNVDFGLSLENSFEDQIVENVETEETKNISTQF